MPETKDSSVEEKTPLLQQYDAIKDEHEDDILFFRLGDFYEMFYDDAKVAARALEIQLTSKPVGKDTEIPMAGIPIHSYQSYLETLVENGHRVAICEQVQDASEATGVVEREVVRVVTPGTLTEEDYLDSGTNNYLLSYVIAEESVGQGGTVGLAYVDLSTGEFETTQFEDDEDFSILGSEINRLHPSEILVSEEEINHSRLSDMTEYRENIAVTTRPGWQFESEVAESQLQKPFEEDVLERLGEQSELKRAAGAVVQYLEETQRQTLAHLDRINTYDRESFMVLDGTSQRNLELVKSLTGQDYATLRGVLDETDTAMGSRRLRQWILQPLMNVKAIRERQQAIRWFVENGPRIKEIKNELQHVYDIQRIVGKIGSNRANPRDLKALGESLERIPKIKDLLPEEGSLEKMANELNEIRPVREELDTAIVESPPAKISEGEIFKDEYNEDLDQLREAMRGGKEWLSTLQKQERERTGIDSLKVGFNKVHGYYIEVTKANLDSVPDEYERKQTLANSERYITSGLKEKEQVILGADEKAKALEEELFTNLRTRLGEHIHSFKSNADILADLDVIAGLATIARERGYTCPRVDWNVSTQIQQGRHPVVEEIHEEEFVPNDLLLDEDRRIVVLTGPNMSGKSTYIRQVALIAIMAQMGSFVPADDATIGMVDQVFTRVGAHDFLAGGKSTFMVEMTETADILNHATKNSLLILDEVGRGTSTFDGVAIARSVVEYIVRVINARTMFATNYHELTDLDYEYDPVFIMTVRAREWDDEIVFLRQVEEGRSDRSYGVQVASLAGLPQAVIERSQQLLERMEEGREFTNFSGIEVEDEQFDMFHPARQVMNRIRDLDLDDFTPLEALNLLHELKNELPDENGEE